MAKPKVRVALKLPKISTRKAEVDRIVDLLNGGQFADDAQAARAVLSAAFGLLAERDWWVVANKIDPDAPIVLYGLFATESAALKTIADNSLALMGACSVMQVNGLDEREARIDALEAQVEHACASCGHAEVAHRWPRQRVTGCVVGRCTCQTFVEPPRAIPRVTVG